ncbi:MAG: hypothetical protein COA33_000335 [Fluviicola sp.]|nr:hypothetical protein [Fluviicola sp.]
MNYWIKHIALIFFGVLPFLSMSNSTFSEGIEAFNTKNYALAADKFDSIISISPNNISAYFNYGLAKMKTRNYGEAIWGFEKVLKFRPADAEAKEKLQECYLEINSNVFWEYRLNGFQSSLYSISANAWGFLAVLFALLLAVAIVVFRTKQSHSTRRVMLLIGAVSSFLLIFSILLGTLSKNHATSDRFAIVTVKNVKSLQDKVVIDEGSLVEVVEVDGDKMKVELDGEVLLVRLEDVRVV